MKPKVKVFTQSGKLIGEFDDEEMDEAIKIIIDHIENGNVILIGEDISDILIY